ncbi:hypothetical protein [Burkholderia ubonensis]|nr:hypothetical protein [Burkholderia ubonensis]
MGIPQKKFGDTTPWDYVAAIGAFKEAAGKGWGPRAGEGHEEVRKACIRP